MTPRPDGVMVDRGEDIGQPVGNKQVNRRDIGVKRGEENPEARSVEEPVGCRPAHSLTHQGAISSEQAKSVGEVLHAASQSVVSGVTV